MIRLSKGFGGASRAKGEARSRAGLTSRLVSHRVRPGLSRRDGGEAASPEEGAGGAGLHHPFPRLLQHRHGKAGAQHVGLALLSCLLRQSLEASPLSAIHGGRPHSPRCRTLGPAPGGWSELCPAGQDSRPAGLGLQPRGFPSLPACLEPLCRRWSELRRAGVAGVQLAGPRASPARALPIPLVRGFEESKRLGRSGSGWSKVPVREEAQPAMQPHTAQTLVSRWSLSPREPQASWAGRALEVPCSPGPAQGWLAPD